MNILVVNDDGYDAIGIEILANALLKYGNVTVIAPDRGRSAASHSVILHSPLEFKLQYVKNSIKYYSLSGMPSDCVRISSVLNKKFDIVFSGINNGLNLGTDIIYSGTVAAAREAQIEGMCAVAISTDTNSFDIVNSSILELLDYVFENKLYSKSYVLNINYPTNKYKKHSGYRLATQGKKIFNTKFELMKDGMYHVSSEEEIHDDNDKTDVYLADLGYITFVPLKVEQVDDEAYKLLEGLVK